MHEDDGVELNDYSKAQPPTKTVGQSIWVILKTLALGAAIVLLFRIRSVASGIGYFLWIAATSGPAFAAAFYLNKHMAGYHAWARFIVAVITFFSVALAIAAALNAHHS